jgi:hypothetical protein
VPAFTEPDVPAGVQVLAGAILALTAIGIVFVLTPSRRRTEAGAR